MADETRRSLLKLIGVGIAGLAVGVAGGYSLAPARVTEVVKTITKTQPETERVSTVTVTSPVTQTITKAAAPVSRLPKDTIKIGLLTFKSGVWATFGDLAEQGARLAVEEINAAGGILGSKLQLIVRDELADVVKQARELVEAERVDFLLGPSSSGNAIRLGPIMPELNKILISGDAATPRFTEEFVYQKGIKLLFRTTSILYQDGCVAAAIAADLPISRWASLHPDYEYGRATHEWFKRYLKTLRPDAEFVIEQWFPSPGTTDFTKYISAIMATDAEGLFTVAFSGEAIAFYRQAMQLGLFRKLKAIINSPGYQPDIPYALGKDYPRLELGTWVSGNDYIWIYPPSSINERFVRAYVNRWGKVPGAGGEPTYTAIYMIKAALEMTGSLDVDTLIKAMEGMVLASPAGIRWIRPEDHQAIYDLPFGKISDRTINVGGEIPILTDIKGLPAWLYLPAPPDYKMPLLEYPMPL
jgi:branched-chain amino acid transport system substrate-binding protein